MAHCADAPVKPESPGRRRVVFDVARISVKEALPLLAQIDGSVAIFHDRQVRLETASAG
jgi:hypothetical protein